MGYYLNPGTEVFDKIVNSEIYVDKTGLLNYTNNVSILCRAISVSVVRAVLENPRLHICWQHITAVNVIQKACFLNLKLPEAGTLKDI